MADTLMYLGLSSLVRQALYYLWRDKIPKEATLAGHVTKLNIYPVKSTREIDVQHITCTSDKGPYSDHLIDRQFLLVESESEELITIRQYPRLILVRPKFDGRTLTLSAPGSNDDVTVDIKDVMKHKKVLKSKTYRGLEGFDCGDIVSKWLLEYLSRDNVRLIYCDPNMKRRDFQVVHGDWYIRWTKHAKPEDKLFYQDTAPFHIISEESAQDLSVRVGKDISPMQFRPTIMVSAIEGAYDEDSWKEVFIGKTRFKTIMLTERCVLTTIDKDTAVRSDKNEPLQTLKSYRSLGSWMKGPMFGSYLVVERPGTIQVGDPIYVTRGFDMNAIW